MEVYTYLPNPSTQAGYDTRSIFKLSLTGLNSEFSFSLTCCLTKAKEPSLLYYLLIAGGRIIGFIPFQQVLVLCEMQSVLSRIWTRVAVSISYDDNKYTMGTSTSVEVYKTLKHEFPILGQLLYLNLTVYHCSNWGLPPPPFPGAKATEKRMEIVKL